MCVVSLHVTVDYCTYVCVVSLYIYWDHTCSPLYMYRHTYIHVCTVVYCTYCTIVLSHCYSSSAKLQSIIIINIYTYCNYMYVLKSTIFSKYLPIFLIPSGSWCADMISFLKPSYNWGSKNAISCQDIWRRKRYYKNIIY